MLLPITAWLSGVKWSFNVREVLVVQVLGEGDFGSTSRLMKNCDDSAHK
ncbi:hypothetical protein H6G28_27135 [Nostoc sp. FACHB-190]|nr:hypothetical protein [Nostoc sp. FACHB-190]